MFTVMFALGRLPGWISQWKEMRLKGDPSEDQDRFTKVLRKETTSISQADNICLYHKKIPRLALGFLF
jgi:citrate synthase